MKRDFYYDVYTIFKIFLGCLLINQIMYEYIVFKENIPPCHKCLIVEGEDMSI